MKNTLLIILFLILVSMNAAFIEAHYCHTMTTTPPFGAGDDYIKTNRFCRINANIGLPGGLLLIGLDWDELLLK